MSVMSFSIVVRVICVYSVCVMLVKQELRTHALKKFAPAREGI